ncbi:MAG: tetratricopeptide repeat protein [Planctomycetota bacterium]|jgi:hypothetical protein
MDCASLAPQIDALADGESSPEAEAHLEACAACRARFAGAQRLTGALVSGLADGGPDPEAAQRLQRRIASDVRTQQRTRTRRPAPVALDARRGRGAPLLAAAAVLLATAVPAAWWLRGRGAAPAEPERPPVVAAQPSAPPAPPMPELPEPEQPPVPSARPDFTAALALDREFAAAWQRNDFDAAAALLDRLIAEYPAYGRVRRGTSAHFRIACDGRRFRWADALQGSRRFAADHPDSPHLDYVRYFEVVYLARLGRFDDAVARQAELLAARPPSKYAANLRALDHFIAQLRTASPTPGTPR